MSMFTYTKELVRRAGMLLGLLAFAVPAILGQTTVSGVVKDASGAALVGASVVVQGTTGGALSGEGGAYRVAVPAGATTLVFSYLGYQKQEVQINGRTQIDVTLAEENSNLGEVVIIGYGQQAKKDLTTSVATVTARDIRDQPVNSFDQALVGKIAGVQIQQTSGAPGAGLSVRVRGVGSITAGNDPLYVIDGVPVSNDNSRATGQRPGSQYADNPINVLSTINPSDIESVQVLKDASAAAIYGSRGSNGVVLITTKRGKSGAPRVNYTAYYGVQETTTRIDMLNAYEWSLMNYEGRNNTYKDRFPAGKDTDDNAVRAQNVPNQPAALIPPQVTPYLSTSSGLTDTDWQAEIFRRAPIQSHAVSLSGGTANLRYYSSVEYMDQTGLVIGSGFQRYSGRFNMEASRGRLKAGLNLNPALTRNDIVNSEGPWFDESVIGLALSISPIWPVYNEDGSYNFGANAWGFAMTDFLNPVALALEVDDNLDHLRLLGNVYAEYSFLKNLSYRISLGTDLNNFRREYYRPSIIEAVGRKGASVPIGSYRTQASTNWLVEHLLNYSTTFGKHSLAAIAGFSAQKEAFTSSEITSSNFPNDLVQTLNAGQVTAASSFAQEWSLLSALSRVQYNYADRYYLSAALRADGSSRFGANNKWGYFPSASVGWRVSEEAFLQGVQALSDLKLRASYGITGNFQIPNYGSVGLLGYDNYVLGSANINTGLAPSTPSNPDLGWERTSMIDVGLDLGLFDGFVSLTADYYLANTTDLLLNVPVPMSSGFTTELRNIGEVQNRGIELSLALRDIKGDFTWSLTGNFASNKNEVISLAEGVPQILTSGGTGTTLWITTPGEAIGSYYNPVYDGVFNNQEEIDSQPHLANARPGDLRFLDVNGDGKIDFATDRQIQGSYFPDYTFGAAGEVAWKGLDFAASVQGAHGQEILNLMRRYIYNQEGNMNLMRGSLNRWQSEAQPGDGQTNRANRLQTGSNGQTSNWHLEDGSFTRVRNITLGYTFSKSLLSKARIENLRIYASVQNPFTFTNYLGYNPEVSSRPDNALNPGEDYATYPLARTYTFGLTLSI